MYNSATKSNSANRSQKIDRRLGDYLVESGAVSREDVERAVLAAQASKRRLGEVLLELGLAEERDVYQQLAMLHHVRFAEVAELLAIVDRELVKKISRVFQEHQHLVPVTIEHEHLIVATTDPLSFHPELASAVDVRDVELVLVSPTDYRRLRLALDLASPTGSSGENSPLPVGSNLLSSEHHLAAPITELFQAILLDAIAERASDIHLEVYGERVRVRIRVDGDLRDVPHLRLTMPQLMAVVSVAKVRAKMDLSEHRAPQGGRFTVRAGEQAFDVRAQTQPSLHGEHLVLRLLPQDKQLLTIADLGFPPELAKRFRRLLDSPGGLVLVVGPTGSGKSTTLYAGLQVLASQMTRKVITIEDPIEYAIDGIQQSQVLPEVGFTFATAMRAFVREDPDVILIGEIRDAETALEALRASQTGHLVLSTLHCNDTVDAVQRLIDLGMHPNSIASELAAVFAQRLAKRICDGCRAPHEPSPELLAEVFPGGAPAGFKSFRGTGCNRCGGNGTHGRIAMVEYLSASSAMRRAIARRLTVEDLRDAARQAGWSPMRTHALSLVEEGIIGLEELPEALTPERLGAD